MVSSLDNWDGSLSKVVKENASRIPNLLDSSTASGASTLNKTTDERIAQGWQAMVTTLDVNRTVCCLFDGFCLYCASSRGLFSTTRQI
jgi:hypothetical protein